MDSQQHIYTQAQRTMTRQYKYRKCDWSYSLLPCVCVAATGKQGLKKSFCLSRAGSRHS